jgi:hypothetical protein
VSKEAQLQWEARWARPAALAAFVAAVALLAQVVMYQAVLEDRPRVQALPDFLLSVDENPGLYLGSAIVQGIGGLLLLPVFLYLFRAIRGREGALPGWFVYLVYLGPLVFGLSAVLGAVDRIDLAHQFADGSYSFPDADPNDDPDLTQCPAIRGNLGDGCAEELLSDNPNGLVFGLSFGGSLAVAFLFVMLPLRARRVGLLSPFMSILGVIAGALLVLQLVPVVPVIIQAFWLGAIGALYLGAWPGGRGPAWDSGEPDPWPSAAERRGLTRGRGEPEPEEPGAEEPEPAALGDGEPEPEPQRPASRKRKRKSR